MKELQYKNQLLQVSNIDSEIEQMENFEKKSFEPLTLERVSYLGTFSLNEHAITKKSNNEARTELEDYVVYCLWIYFNVISHNIVEPYIFLVNKANISDSLDMPKCSETTSYTCNHKKIKYFWNDNILKYHKCFTKNAQNI